MVRVAIIGSGIAGMGCAHRLQDVAQLTVYEKEPRFGGHTHTVTVDEDGQPVPIDTGFMVFNTRTYPNLIRLFTELNIPTVPTAMSFSVNHVPDGVAFAGSRPRQLFARWQQALNPAFYGMLRDIFRFNKLARLSLDDTLAESLSLADFLSLHRFRRRFRQHYLLPMTSAIWSTPEDQMLRFPARTLFRFMDNHGLLGVRSHFQWWTVRGGSQVYRDRLLAPFRDRCFAGRPAVQIREVPLGVEVTDTSGQTDTYDYAVVATHADEALRLLAAPSPDQARLLGAFRYASNPTLLHTDAAVMPRPKVAWASWNYRVDRLSQGTLHASTHYWMNSLQKVSDRQNYFVSLNDPGLIRPETILWKGNYTHPMFDAHTQAAQAELPRLNQAGKLLFAGSYFRYGFHEDALSSGLDAAEHIRQLLGHARLAV